MKSEKSSGVQVPTGLHLQSRFFAATDKVWRRLGNIETSVLSDELEQINIQKPVYVSGLARSGTTILTEMLEKHPDLTSHHYSDFPNIWTPYWRNFLLQKTRKGDLVAGERAHKDRIKITNDSPEAVEEVLWSYFFPQCHATAQDNTLGKDISNPAFESFYAEHIQKLLLVRESPRYLAKGNYNLGRFLYILKLFPDARFLVPYRNPVNHIASLIKQHRFFLKADAENPRVATQLALSGHYEFGPKRSAVNLGNDGQHQAITNAWAEGHEVEGWALYWAASYQFLLDQVRVNEDLAQATLFIAYEDLCDHSEQTIDSITAHCALEPDVFADVREYYCEHLSVPEYYQPDFSSEEIDKIQQICEPVVSELGRINSSN